VFAPHCINAITKPSPDPSANPNCNHRGGSEHEVWCKNRGEPLGFMPSVLLTEIGGFVEFVELGYS